MPRPNGGSGAARMAELAAQLPSQLRDGFREGKEQAPPFPPGTRQVVVAGMGGSAIAGDLALALTSAETELDLQVVRSDDLPKPIRAPGWLIAISYSGNTRETLHAYDEAGRRGMPRLAITSGGELEARATRDGVPVLAVPPGGPPRAWVGYLLGTLLGALDSSFPDSNEDRLRAAADSVESAWPALSAKEGSGAELARAVGERLPTICAEMPLAGLARRWKTQVEENAKRGATFEVLPEMFHNAVVGWDRAGLVDRSSRALLFLEWAGSSLEISPRQAYLVRLLQERKIPVLPVRLSARELLGAIIEGVAVGDLFSLALAANDGIDPMPTDAIDRMKAATGNGPGRAGRGGRKPPRKSR
jgi:glucose/mannose-6-phosphate isomerase